MVFSIKLSDLICNCNTLISTGPQGPCEEERQQVVGDQKQKFFLCAPGPQVLDRVSNKINSVYYDLECVEIVEFLPFSFNVLLSEN